MTARSLRGAAFAALALTTAPVAAHAAILPTPTVADGSFETFDFSARSAGDSYEYGATGIAGATFNGKSGVQKDGSRWEFAAAPSGSQTAFLQSGSDGIGNIVLSLGNLVVGQAYKVSFDAAARPVYSTVNPFTVAVNGAQIGAFTATDLAWTTFSTGNFLATGTTASLSFTGSASSVDSAVGLDSISVSAVPEPAAWAMMILGMGVIGFAMRRRTSAVAAIA